MDEIVQGAACEPGLALAVQLKVVVGGRTRCSQAALRGSGAATGPLPCPPGEFKGSGKGAVCQYSFPRPSLSNASAQCSGSSMARLAKFNCW